MVREELNVEDAEDLIQENEDLERYTGVAIHSRAFRLSFFSEEFSTPQTLASLNNEFFLGYVIVKYDPIPGQRAYRIYESVISQNYNINYFTRGSQDWNCRVGEKTFRVSGYLYAQQNNMTNVCAHVACRTVAARFHKSGDMTYREMNNLATVNIDHVSNRVGNGVGLTSLQMINILEAAGARCSVGDYTTLKPGITSPPFQKLLYGSIESGYPAIICFAAGNNAHHAIPAFGHTFNEDAWVPKAELSYFIGKDTAYIPSESWVTTYIAHDDNWGSDYCVPRHFLYTKQHCDKWPSGPQLCVIQLECVSYIIATLPRDVKVDPLQAEVIGMDYLSSILPQLSSLECSGPWAQRLNSYAERKLLVLRPILVDNSNYIRHLEKIKDWDSNSIQPELLPTFAELKGKFWLVEVSVPDLYSTNRRKLGEVLITAEIDLSPQRDFTSYVLARVPGYFVLYKGGSIKKPNYSFIPSGISGHVPLFGCEEFQLNDPPPV